MNFLQIQNAKKKEKEPEMKPYASLSPKEAEKELAALRALYEKEKSMHLSLDLSRGKPNSEQLDMTQELLDAPLTREMCFSPSGFDYRNYGIFDGVPEMKKLFSDLLGIPEEMILIGGNSSLQLVYDTLMRAMVFGVVGSDRPWAKEEGLKWLCVVPGYDRHFRIAQSIGFELVNVRMLPTGPDMDEVERLVASDPKIKGIFCVPKYSNPTGNTYSDETVVRLAKMKTAAKDFRIIWDNAYAVHDFDENGDTLLDIFAEAEKYGNQNRIFYFTSTSKISFPGAGISMMAMSPENLAQAKKYISVETIGFDKLNQIRHLAYFKNAAGVMAHMRLLGKNVGKKIAIAEQILDRDLGGLGILEYQKPKGGYFLSIDTLPGCAKRVFALMAEAGVKLTQVGDTFPYGVDPEDRNLRLAPTYPSDEDLVKSMDLLTVTIRIASLEKLFAL